MIIVDITQRKDSRKRSGEGTSTESLEKHQYLRCELGRNRPIRRLRISAFKKGREE